MILTWARLRSRSQTFSASCRCVSADPSARFCRDSRKYMYPMIQELALRRKPLLCQPCIYDFSAKTAAPHAQPIEFPRPASPTTPAMCLASVKLGSDGVRLQVSGRQHTRRARWAFVLGVGIALAGFSIDFERARGASSPPLERTTPVVVAAVEHRDIPIELPGVGTFEAYKHVTVKPRINRQITALDFTAGTSVRPGQVLARLDDHLLSAQLQQARAARLRDEASLADAMKKLARATPLAPRSYVSREDLDSPHSQVAVPKATVAADRAAVKTAQVELDYTVIRAPIGGITGIRMADAGNVISTIDPGIVVITQITPITVVFSLPADELSSLSVGASCGHCFQPRRPSENCFRPACAYRQPHRSADHHGATQSDLFTPPRAPQARRVRECSFAHERRARRHHGARASDPVQRSRLIRLGTAI